MPLAPFFRQLIYTDSIRTMPESILTNISHCIRNPDFG